MKWSEFLDTPVDSGYNGQVKTSIECPKCGRPVYYDSSIILTCYPAKYSYWCACGWKDFAPIRWAGRKEE